MEYKDFFSPETLEKLNKKSAENLKAMIGDKNLMQTVMSSQQLLSQIIKAETPYKAQLEKLAIDMVKELYPIITQEGIELDAKIVSISDVNKTLDEIQVTPRQVLFGLDEEGRFTELIKLSGYSTKSQALKDIQKEFDKKYSPDNYDPFDIDSDGPISIKSYAQIAGDGSIYFVNDLSEFAEGYKTEEDWGVVKWSSNLNEELNEIQNFTESISPESRRRIINSITQGAALRGAFAFYLFKEHLDEIDPSLVEKYNQIMKNSFGIYDDENAIAMMLSMLAQGQKIGGGSSKVILSEIQIKKPEIIAGSKALEIKEWIQDELAKSISEIANEFGSVTSILLNESDAYYEAVKDFIIDQMILDNYEIVKDYQEILISQSNKNILTHQDIVDYLDINPEVKNYLERIFWSYYFEAIDFKDLTNKIFNAFVKKYPDLDDVRVTDIRDFFFRQYDVDLPWPDDVIFDPNFESYLYRELLKADKLNEIQIQALNFSNPKTIIGISKIDTRDFNTGDHIELVDLGPYYTYVPSGNQEKMILIPKNYIEVQKENHPYVVSPDGMDLLKDLYSQKKTYTPTINEIQIKNPFKSPLKINSFEEWEKNKNILKQKGYKWKNYDNSVWDLDEVAFEDEDFPFYLILYRFDAKKKLLSYVSKYNKTLDTIVSSGLLSPYITEQKSSGIKIVARAICFPMLVHELIKGLYELISLQGFKGDKASNQAVVDKVDSLKNEPSDIRYGKFIFDALNDVFANSDYDDPRIREFFFAEVYQLDDDEFISFIENALNENLTPSQQRWVNNTLKEIAVDLRSDDYDTSGLDEIQVNKPNTLSLLVLSKIKKIFPEAYLVKDWLNRGEDYFQIFFFNKEEQALNIDQLSYDPKLKKFNVSLGEDDLHGRYFKKLESILKYLNSKVKVNNFTNEIQISLPTSNLIKDPRNAPLLNIKIGKYDVSKERKGVPVAFNSANVSTPTKNRVLAVFDKLGIKPQKAWVGWIVEDDQVQSLKSTFVLSHYNEEPILIAQLQTHNPSAGQIYLYSKYFKSGKAMRLPDGEHKLDNSSLFADINATKEQILKALKIPDSSSEEKTQINEFNEKTILSTIERWKEENPKVDDKLARQLITRFDQIKNSLAQKLDIVSLSDELKQNKNYLNIDKYSFDDMSKLIRSLPESPEKVKKDAIANFVEREQIDKTTAQSYVARFLNKKDALKYAVENGTEDGTFTKEEVQKYIPSRLLSNNGYLDPRNWSWKAFEQMLDAIFPSYKKADSESGENLASTDADKVYDKNGIEIYKGDDVNKCISYNPVTAAGRKKYGWCVTQPGNTNYDYYRFAITAPTFYFIFDRNKTSTPEHSPFEDNWHAFVIQVNADGESYVVTDASNRGDRKADSWEAISKLVPSDTWSKIQGLKSYFKPIPLSAVERGRKFASGKALSIDEFKELAQDEKILYVQGKASKNALSPEIQKILPKYKISLEGRSTTLANVAIDSGQVFPYSSLKDHESLAKRYAIFRFRHTDYSKKPIPLPYVKYLDKDAQQKYLDTYADKFLSYNLIEKFFDKNILEKYIDEESKKFKYIQPQYVKYIKDPATKAIYDLYNKTNQDWVVDEDVDIDEEKLENLNSMPEQNVTPIPFTLDQWNKFSPKERQLAIKLSSEFSNNAKYKDMLYAFPYVVKDGQNSYVLLPKTNKDFDYSSWALVDINGKIIKDNIPGFSTIGDNSLINGFPDESEKGTLNRAYDIKDLKIEQ